MFRLTSLTLLVAALALAGCGGSHDADHAAHHEDQAAKSEAAPARDDAAVPMLVDGYQVVRVLVTNTGYEPSRIRLHAGAPAKFVFVQEATTECASHVQMPGLGVPATELPEGKETVIDFTPSESGTYSFTCGMDMLRGTILVES